MNSLLTVLDSKLLISLLSALNGLGLAVFVWHRSRSGHSWLSKQWHAYRGNLHYNFPLLTDFFHELDAVDHFRFITGIHAPTLASVYRTIRWAKRRNVSPTKIAACKSFFNLARGRIKTRNEMPHWSIAVTAYLIAMALTGLAACLVVAAVYDHAFLSFEKSGTYFTMNEQRAKPLKGSGINLSDCKANQTSQDAVGGFTAEEVSLICGEANAGRVRHIVKSTVLEQRIASASALLPVTIILIPLFIFATTWARATDLRNGVIRARLERQRRHLRRKSWLRRFMC